MSVSTSATSRCRRNGSGGSAATEGTCRRSTETGAGGQARIHRVHLTAQANAYAERFVRTIKESCLDRMIFFGEGSLRNAINEFVDFYHRERNHQGLGNRLIDPREEIGAKDGPVACRERLGGLLWRYYRKAA